eukprot:2742466-Alexandrium_andersonii.AAC.1
MHHERLNEPQLLNSLQPSALGARKLAEPRGPAAHDGAESFRMSSLSRHLSHSSRTNCVHLSSFRSCALGATMAWQ